MAQAPGNVYWGWFPQSLLMAHWADPAYYGHIVLDTAVVGIGSPAPQSGPKPTLAGATVAGSAVRVSFTAGTGADARLTVHDAAGRRVRTLVSGKAEPGHRDAVWDLTDDSGWRVAAGTYFLRLSVSGHAVSARAVALR
jgi:hypothetical protein